MNPIEKHAGISPSKLSRILNCPGSLKLDIRTETRSVYADEGSMLHDVVEKYLLVSTQNFPPHEFSKGLALKVNLDLTIEQLSAVQDCVEYAHKLVSTIHAPMVFIEERVSMASYHPALWDTGGTSDLIVIDTEAKHVHVVDWKFGKGIPVYADGNEQLLAYAAGALLAKNIMYSIDTVTLHVVQPRLDNYSSDLVPTSKIHIWLADRVIPRIELAYSDNPPLVPGKTQCRWCPGSTKCEARFEYMSKLAEDVFKAHTEMKTLDYASLAQLLSRESELTQYFKDIRDYLYDKAKKGEEIPGFKLVAGRSIRMWSDTIAAEAWLLDQFDINDVFEQKLVSPAKAEKLRRGLKTDEAFNSLITKPLGEPVLVHSSDKRAPLTYRTAEEIFGRMV